MAHSLRKQAVRLAFLLLIFTPFLQGSSLGELEGTVTLPTGDTKHGAAVLIVQLGITVETDQSGKYRFVNIPPGTYDVLAHSGSLRTLTQLVEVRGGETVTMDFELELKPIRHEITVTARGQAETAFEAVQSVISVDSFALSEKMGTSLGKVLDGESGISKRGFGPGSERPVIRGFDGDRVLVMQDGIRVGSLGSTSGDHGEPIDPGSVERVEIVKGPATLLYGSNAIGGVVNVITGHHELHQRPHQGLTGQFTGSAGSGNAFGGINARAEYGQGGWLFWVGGGTQRSGDYSTPIGEIENSASRQSNTSAGLGFFGSRAYASFGYTFNDGRYGIPGAEMFHGHDEGEDEHGHDEGEEEEEEELEGVDLDFHRHNYRFGAGVQELGGPIHAFNLSLTYSDWNHDELEVLTGGEEEVGTEFDNTQWVYRGVFEQGRSGILGGRFGFWGQIREYEAAGEEALSPPVDQNAFALFAFEELNFEKAKIQFGGRIEFNDYTVRGLQQRGHEHGEEEEEEGEDEEPELVQLPDRDFTGFSAGVGARFEVAPDSAIIANFTSSHRAPALEELYNFGPHVGTRSFEVGNPNLEAERSNGFDLSFRHLGERFQANASFFYYDIRNFIYLQPSGEEIDGLPEGDFMQGDSRFIGAEFRTSAALHEKLWLNFGVDAVDAQLTDNGQGLPRIPPLKARVGLDFRHNGLSFRPEMVVAADQAGDALAPFETRTPGYAVFNLKASYTVPRQHFLHQFSVDFFNVGDRLYRNHASFIKDLAPEIGRGVRFGYTVKFF